MDTSFEEFIEQTTGESHLRVQDDLGDGFYRLRAAEAQRRQAKQDIRSFEDVVLEMLRNARDAHARMIFVATWKEGDTRHLTMIDDGDGIPTHLQSTIFEPFVTSKLDTFRADRWGVHGRGMALFSISQNTDAARVVASEPGRGAVFSVSATPETLPERKDQSTLPRIIADQAGQPQLRGPRNIARTVTEFALDERERIAVYLGSPTEVAATLWRLSRSVSSSLDPSSQPHTDDKIFQAIGDEASPDELAHTCDELGLPMSSRSARRIQGATIQPLAPFLVEVFAQDDQPGRRDGLISNGDGQNPRHQTPCRPSNAPSIVLGDEQRRELASRALDSFQELAEAFYLRSDVEPQVSVANGVLRISIPLLPLE